MLNLNLISKTLKREIKLKRAYDLLKKISLLFVVTTVIFGVIFLVTQLILLNNFKEIGDQTGLTLIDDQNYNARVKEINDKLSSVSQIQNEFVSYTHLIKIITEKIPAGIIVNGLKIDQEKQQIKIRGRAGERDDLLRLEESLEELPIFPEINLPLKSILEKKNIDFEITAKLDLAKINL